MTILNNHSPPSISRSADYRQRYFERHHGYAGIHCCSYCGRLLSRRTATIDHIIPIHAVAKSRLLRWFYGWGRDINDLRNLTTACSRCNSAKGAHCGLWILRGYLGRVIFPVFWILMLMFWARGLSYTLAVVLILTGNI